jgi:hypothetical protein
VIIVFTNDCDKYTEESFIEVHDFFKNHGIPFSDSFFYSDKETINFIDNKEFIKDYYKKGEIEILHGLPVENREEIEKYLRKLKYNGIKIKIFTNHGRMTDNLTNLEADGDDSESEYYISDLLYKYGIRYISTNRRLFIGDSVSWFVNVMRDGLKFIDFKRISYTKPAKKIRTSNFQFLPELFSRINISYMKEFDGIYFTYIHMAKNVYRFTDRSKNCILRVADDNEIEIKTTLEVMEKWFE